jgi:predicted permease
MPHHADYLQNPLVWSTGVAVLLSAAGSAALLDPSSPRAIRQLAFLEALLGWFAQTTAPLTLFTTGLWMFTNSAAQSSPAAARPAKPAGAAASAAACAAHGASGFGSTSVCPRQVGRYLLLRATVAPGLMVGICWALGFRGDLAHALVILALLPVAQTAFVVCKQAETGMAAVSSLLVASLLVMLPQLMLVLALLEGLGVFAASA